MRVVGIVFLSLTPLLFGLDYSKLLKKRLEFFSTFKEFILFVKEQIRFSGRERDEIFTLALADPRFDVPLFENIKKSLNGEETLAKTIEKHNDIRLNNKEIQQISAFISGLGSNDTEGQLNHCDYYFLVFGQLAEKSNEIYLSKSRLSVGLALSLSSVMFIIMI